MYSTLSPCIDCLKVLKAAGISKVYFKEEYKKFNQVQEIAKKLDVLLVQLKQTRKVV
jgi:deoxycytidylate deaminase